MKTPSITVLLGTILLSVMLSACLSRQAETDPAGDEGPPQPQVTQESVVSTSFENSWIFAGFSASAVEGPLIPGLNQQLIPQGMAYWVDEEMLIISNYMDDFTAGALTLIDMESNLLKAVHYLFNADGSPHKGHLGGLAISREYLWIASGPGIYAVPLTVLSAAENHGAIILPEPVLTETKASFATFHDGVLWIGEFVSADGNYTVSKAHHVKTRSGAVNKAWMGGYRLDAVSDMLSDTYTADGKLVPDYIISIPNEIQGAVFADYRLFLSASYGRRNNSRLLIYDSPLDEPAHKILDLTKQSPTPLWFLDTLNRYDEVTLPPMSEAAVLYGERIAVLFESASIRYRGSASNPVDRVYLLSQDIESRK